MMQKFIIDYLVIELIKFMNTCTIMIIIHILCSNGHFVNLT